jgi:hypothetical protein
MMDNMSEGFNNMVKRGKTLMSQAGEFIQNASIADYAESVAKAANKVYTSMTETSLFMPGMSAGFTGTGFTVRYSSGAGTPGFSASLNTGNPF